MLLKLWKKEKDTLSYSLSRGDNENDEDEDEGEFIVSSLFDITGNNGGDSDTMNDEDDRDSDSDDDDAAKKIFQVHSAYLDEK